MLQATVYPVSAKSLKCKWKPRKLVCSSVMHTTTTYCQVVDRRPQHCVGVRIQTLHKIHPTINRQNRKAAVFFWEGDIFPYTLLNHPAKFVLADTDGDGSGRAARCGSRWFKFPSSPKNVSTHLPQLWVGWFNTQRFSDVEKGNVDLISTEHCLCTH